MDKALVTADNFNRAETDKYFAVFSHGTVGVLAHNREPANADNQRVVRDNPNVLASHAVFDLDAGPVTLTLPDSGDRFMSLMITNEDHYTATKYDAAPHTLTRDEIGTRYVFIAVRILVDPNDPDDVATVHALQDAMTLDQPGGLGTFDLPEWDTASQDKVREALVTLGSTLPDSKHMFGTPEQVEPVRHLIGTAIGWGGNNEHDALYVIEFPIQCDGKTVHRLTFREDELPIDGWWAISVYNAKGYFEKNDRDIYTINSANAVRGDDGTITVQFGGHDDSTDNCLPIFPEWNYAVRLYLPRQELIDGGWTFPKAQPADLP
jgi:hypothetical protein